MGVEGGVVGGDARASPAGVGGGLTGAAAAVLPPVAAGAPRPAPAGGGGGGDVPPPPAPLTARPPPPASLTAADRRATPPAAKPSIFRGARTFLGKVRKSVGGGTVKEASVESSPAGVAGGGGGSPPGATLSAGPPSTAAATATVAAAAAGDPASVAAAAAAAGSPTLAAEVAHTIDSRQARLLALLDAEVAALTAARSGAIPYSVLAPLTARTLDAIVDDGMPLLAEYAALDDRAARLASRLASAAADGDAAVGEREQMLIVAKVGLAEARAEVDMLRMRVATVRRQLAEAGAAAAAAAKGGGVGGGGGGGGGVADADEGGRPPPNGRGGVPPPGPGRGRTGDPPSGSPAPATAKTGDDEPLRRRLSSLALDGEGGSTSSDSGHEGGDAEGSGTRG